MGIPKSRPTSTSYAPEFWVSTSAKLRPPTRTSVSPRKRNWVPIVTTRDGMPTIVTRSPLKSPASAPTARAAAIPSSTLPVASQALTKPTIPSAMIEGKERSMSPAMMTRVRGIAITAKYGVVSAKDR